MMRIPLTQGKVAVVDDDDYGLISGYKWYAHCENGSWYAVAALPGTGRGGPKLRMHRVVTGAQPGQLVDHINGDGLDNRRCNLRVCSQSENQMNRHSRANRFCEYRGVTWNRAAGKWQAQIKLDGKSRYLGVFCDPVQAAKAYDAAARELFGDFANLNFPREVTT